MMPHENLDLERIDSLRREINALHGLLHFSFERRYPDAIRSTLRELITPRVAELESLSEGVFDPF